MILKNENIDSNQKKQNPTNTSVLLFIHNGDTRLLCKNCFP